MRPCDHRIRILRELRASCTLESQKDHNPYHLLSIQFNLRSLHDNVVVLQVRVEKSLQRRFRLIPNRSTMRKTDDIERIFHQTY